MLTNRSGSTTSGQRNERPDPKKLNADCLKNRQSAHRRKSSQEDGLILTAA